MRIRQIVGLLGLLSIAVVVLLITLSPVRVDAGREYLVERVLQELHERGAPSWFEYNELEFTANVVMFVPLGLFLGMLMLRHRWIGALAIGLFSFAVEQAQALFLPERVSDTRDLIANTVGGCIGIALAALLFPREPRRSREERERDRARIAL